jgi:DNA uptake protein ComE-like DNA-binding protein
MSTASEPFPRRRTRGSGLIALGLTAMVSLSFAESHGAARAAAPTGREIAASKATPADPGKLVDINSARRDQLQTLPGIGAVEADKIIASRPYFSKADLATRNVVPTGIYLSLKDRIIAKQKARPKEKTTQGAPTHGS